MVRPPSIKRGWGYVKYMVTHSFNPPLFRGNNKANYSLSANIQQSFSL